MKGLAIGFIVCLFGCAACVRMREYEFAVALGLLGAIILVMGPLIIHTAKHG